MSGSFLSFISERSDKKPVGSCWVRILPTHFGSERSIHYAMVLWAHSLILLLSMRQPLFPFQFSLKSLIRIRDLNQGPNLNNNHLYHHHIQYRRIFIRSAPVAISKHPTSPINNFSYHTKASEASK